jgi:hypothetical protein
MTLNYQVVAHATLRQFRSKIPDFDGMLYDLDRAPASFFKKEQAEGRDFQCYRNVKTELQKFTAALDMEQVLAKQPWWLLQHSVERILPYVAEEKRAEIEGELRAAHAQSPIMYFRALTRHSRTQPELFAYFSEYITEDLILPIWCAFLDMFGTMNVEQGKLVFGENEQVDFEKGPGASICCTLVCTPEAKVAEVLDAIHFGVSDGEHETIYNSEDGKVETSVRKTDETVIRLSEQLVGIGLSRTAAEELRPSS